MEGFDAYSSIVTMGIYLFFGRRFLVFLPPFFGDLGDPFFGNIENLLNKLSVFLVDGLVSVDCKGGNLSLGVSIGNIGLCDIELWSELWYELWTELWSSSVDFVWGKGANLTLFSDI
jgi:hypothetical protein